MTTIGGVPYVPTYPRCTDTCTTDCGHCKGNHEKARLGQIRARAEAATPGPWKEDGLAGDLTSGSTVIAEVLSWWERDAQFIAHSREDVPYLLALLAEKDAVIARMQHVSAYPDPRVYPPVVYLSVQRAALDGQEGR